MSLVTTLVFFVITTVLVFAWLRSLLHPVTRKDRYVFLLDEAVDRTLGRKMEVPQNKVRDEHSLIKQQA